MDGTSETGDCGGPACLHSSSPPGPLTIDETFRSNVNEMMEDAGSVVLPGLCFSKESIGRLLARVICALMLFCRSGISVKDNLLYLGITAML